MAKVFTIATEMRPTLISLIKSCEGKVDLEVTMHSGEWDWGVWLDWQMEKCADNPDTNLVFVDAYDTLFVGDADELDDIVSRKPLVHSSNKSCWPMPGREKWYPKVPGPWKFLNSCGPAGTGSAIKTALSYGMSMFPYPMPDLSRDNDQRFWTDVYLSGYGELDWKCEIWQDLYMLRDDELATKDGRLLNQVHMTWPQFIHASAHTWHRIPKELLDGN
jgi:hypothetical protein